MRETPTRRTDACIVHHRVLVVRWLVLISLFLVFWISIPFLIFIGDRPYGIQLTSIVMYTALVALYTFSANRNGAQPFLISCPVVHRQLLRLALRHAGFLVTLFLFQTLALMIRPDLPAYLNSQSGTKPSLFQVSLGFICAGLGLFEVLSNRSLLEHAHTLSEAQPNR